MSRATQAEVAEAVIKVLTGRVTGRATIKELMKKSHTT